jgi:hypothetical protein
MRMKGMGLCIHKRLTSTVLIKFTFKCVTRSCNTCRYDDVIYFSFITQLYIILEALKTDVSFSISMSTAHILSVCWHLCVTVQHFSLSVIYF